MGGTPFPREVPIRSALETHIQETSYKLSVLDLGMMCGTHMYMEQQLVGKRPWI